ncbi:Fic family protein [Candidatus Poriferisocius sp.]|uniref:Fic family protein n=1 Tax=Candidatus Poriferisocius sp. TaxID=3101276 RepID=UPI003B02A729
MEPDSEDYSGYSVEVDWNGRPVQAWVPALLRERPAELSASAARACERACAALRLADARLPDRWEAMARLLLRNEGVASSGIEGLREPIESVLIAERTGAGGTAGWVAGNLIVIDWALETAHEPLTVDALHRWHRQLMQHGSLPPDMIGVFRPAVGWVGGSSPLDAAYVPPPHADISRLVDDLIAFANTDPEDIDPVSHAAVIHAQFEAIHPYGDGNGRLGRALVSRTLRRQGVTSRSTAPISMAIARDPGGYLSGLRLFEQGDLEPWVTWFAENTERAAATAQQIIDQTSALLTQWEEAVSDLRADHSALALLPHLPAQPLLSAGDVADLLGTSERSARTALSALASRGILSPIDVPSSSPGRTRHWFTAPDLLQIWSI